MFVCSNTGVSGSFDVDKAQLDEDLLYTDQVLDFASIYGDSAGNSDRQGLLRRMNLSINRVGIAAGLLIVLTAGGVLVWRLM